MLLTLTGSLLAQTQKIIELLSPPALFMNLAVIDGTTLWLSTKSGKKVLASDGLYKTVDNKIIYVVDGKITQAKAD